MKIKILNKNNNSLFDIDDGAVFTENYNETLDAGTVTISNLSFSIDIEPYDIIAIYKTGSDSVWKYMCVDTYNEIMECVNPKIYKYEITLFSETKQLEGTVLPNLKITKMPNITRYIYDYINQYMNEYCPKIRVEADVPNNLLDTVTNTQILIDGDNYYYRVSLQSSGIVSSLPENPLRVSATATVTVFGGISQLVTDNNCNIIYSRIANSHWELQFDISLGEYQIPPGISLDSYTVYEHSYTFTPKFTWNNTKIHNKFDIVECPEMQWNTPTLREVLNDLMMVVDCIPVLKNGVLDYLDLTEIKTDISDDTHINYVTRSKSSEDYVSELQVNLVNVTNKEDSFVTKKEYVFFNIPDANATMTTENIFLRTQYPIYRLKSLKMMVPTAAEGQPDSSHQSLPPQIRKWDQLDLTKIWDNGVYVNLVYEYQNWITKKVAYITNSPSNFREWQDYQNWTLYYTRGSNEIRNFNANQKFNTYMTSFLREALYYQIGKRNEPTGYDQYNVFTSTNSSYYPIMFEVEYETLEGCLFRASKGENQENERVIIDNQTNSYVDSYSQGFLEYQKANRLGNEQLQINARYLPTETPLEIAQTYEDTIVYQAQYQFYRDHTEVNAIATKNYVLREYFTGVKSKIRSWKIADGSEALIRHDLFKYYCELSYAPHVEENGLQNLDNYNVGYYLVSPLYAYEAEPLKCAFVRTYDRLENPYPANLTYTGVSTINTYYYLDLISRVVGNSMVFTFKYLDNYWAGQSVHTDRDFNGNTAPTRPTDDVYVKLSDIYCDINNSKIEIDTDALVNGGLPMYQHRYTDDNGEFTSGKIIFSSKLKNVPAFDTQVGEYYEEDIEPGANWTPDNAYSTLTEQSAYFIYNSYQRPRVLESAFKWTGETTPSYDYGEIEFGFDLHKDSQEITNISTQFEFSTDTNDICFSKKWLNLQKAIYDGGRVDLFMVRMYPKNKYNFRRPDEFPNGDASKTFAISFNFNKNSDSNMSTNVTIIITDGNTYSSSTEAKNAAINYAQQYCMYICDYITDYRCLLALNNVPEENCFGINNKPCIKINLNILKSRNKNIYDANNHYLIVGKI